MWVIIHAFCLHEYFQKNYLHKVFCVFYKKQTETPKWSFCSLIKNKFCHARLPWRDWDTNPPTKLSTYNLSAYKMSCGSKGGTEFMEWPANS